MSTGTYSQVHLHLVFAVKYRQGLLAPAWRGRLFEYLAGAIRSEGHKPLAVNGVADHVHIAVGLRPVQAIAELVQRIKQNSSRWINEQRLTPGHFAWQEGYGVFSVSRAHLSPLLIYIANQEEHHQTVRFRDEYERLLRVNEVEYEARFIFHEPV